ncbi:DUF2905 domain-containing protein [Fervidibacillus halotolerans]|uniref:DUF2905 domain-containing protein n=1 Tax=Fervidibacillus halotolerans TaxID=2980027 RepID=A0A9E8LXW6_9BACI|nr:DUF2905 domain-containing protein [Fervidibacillus halotolerans]WAA11569.1 DUF2905 domain-containing protein [Fervidibacillus halotolerans]
MTEIGKFLMFLGGILFFVGLLMQFFNFGKLPGDIVIRKQNATFYFPIMTSILLSILLSLIFFILSKLK